MIEFTYETRNFKTGDAVILIDNIKKNTEMGPNKEFYIDNTIMSELNKMYGLMYIYDISDDNLYCRLQTKKGPQGIKNERFFPSELFKIIKVPKMNDVVTWLYDNQLITYPEQWSFFKNEISSISRFIIKIFQTNLKAIYLINKYNNHLYLDYDPLEALVFYKTLVQQMQLQYHKRYDAFNAQSKRKEFIKICQELDSSWHTNDCISLYEMNNVGVFSRDGEKYISNSDRIEIYKDPKKSILDEKSKDKEFDILRQTIIAGEKAMMELKMQGDTRFIKEINQQVIDELELTIFNVKTIPLRNQILYIFIDKFNNKRFHISEFLFEFYVSSSSKIVENDYLVNYDPNKYKKFFVRDFSVLKTLKFAVNDNHKRFMKLGRF